MARREGPVRGEGLHDRPRDPLNERQTKIRGHLADEIKKLAGSNIGITRYPPNRPPIPGQPYGPTGDPELGDRLKEQILAEEDVAGVLLAAEEALAELEAAAAASDEAEWEEWLHKLGPTIVPESRVDEFEKRIGSIVDEQVKAEAVRPDVELPAHDRDLPTFDIDGIDPADLPRVMKQISELKNWERGSRGTIDAYDVENLRRTLRSQGGTAELIADVTDAWTSGQEGVADIRQRYSASDPAITAAVDMIANAPHIDTTLYRGLSQRSKCGTRTAR